MLSETAEHADLDGQKAPRRGFIACLQCRERKVRCSGSNPCANCVRRSDECVFEQDDRRVTVSEKYLESLKRRAVVSDDAAGGRTDKRRRTGGSSSQRPELAGGGSPAVSFGRPESVIDELDGTTVVLSASSSEDQLSAMRNPLVTTPSRFVTDPTGRRRFLGPSSTWAYSHHIIGIVREYLGSHESPGIPLNVDGAAMPLEFPNMRQVGNQPLTMHEMPSLDYAIYITNTVKFHIGQLYHLFDEASFMQSLYALYNEGPQPLTRDNRLWYIQYLTIMAFGKALLSKESQRTVPPGGEYFIRALELFPDVNGLYQDPILSIEICCGLALYLQSVDHRNSAYVYIGTGLRIALSQGLHRGLASHADERDPDASRLRSVWWTLYILDRKFSSMMGAPSSIHDSDISVPLPASHNSVQKASALGMHVKLSRLIAMVLDSVYSVDGRLDSCILRVVQKSLREIGKVATDLNASPELKINGNGPVGRVQATLNLCYHQCVVLATRPILVCLLQNKLQETAAGSTGAAGVQREVSEPIRALLKTSYESANKALRILSMLKSQDLLETFLPFDLDHAFSSGFVLTIFSALQPFPDTGIDEAHLSVTIGLLDALIANGSPAARFRREELDTLRTMLMMVASKTSLPDTNNVEDGQGESGMPAFPVLGQGISPTDMITAADLLDFYPSLLEGDGNSVNDTDWLWETVERG